MRKNVIEPWNEKWVLKFQAEKDILSQILENEINVSVIHHISSTSLIEIVYSKLIMVILVVIKDIGKVNLGPVTD